jgi:catechol 2,3-dioxygenase-like lactoylglutathione lyase family enzyme
MEYNFDHLHLRCQDLEAAIDFYVNMLGGEVVKRFEVNGMPIVRLVVGNTNIAFSPLKQGMSVNVSADEPCWGAYQIGFTVADLEKAMEELKAKGGKFKNEPFDAAPGVRAVFMEAPDGVEIELMQVSG